MPRIPQDQIDAVLALVDADIDKSLARLFDLIRIPSISTDPGYRDQCKAAAEWLSRDLASIGFDASVRPTTGHPMVVAHQKEAAGPHLLFYGHYDVQPVDPLALWTSDPFEPRLEPLPNGDTAIVARGASDDKGQMMTFVEACRAWKAVTGKLPVQVSILFEGEEEAGSPSLAPFLDATAAELKADMVYVCDTDMWDRETPAVTTMLRGLYSTEVEITCADRDLHSGMFGNAARNALQVLSDVVSSLRTPDGGVAVEGFYDGVKELPEAIKAQWQRLPFDEKGFLADIGLNIPAGEAGRSILEQVWARPSCEINGMSGGYTGEGFKTVIPAKATAKISFRLVEGQVPEKIRDAFKAHVQGRIPADCSVTFKDFGLAPATVMPVESPFLTKTLAALSTEWECEAALAGTGGSIPIIGEFKRRLGCDALLVGFARFDNRVHSPNEKYDLSSFHKGIRSWVRILAALAE
ncbi:M20/M25/M40 family metallo-hydrolase [Neorhizobium galegae]|uniref:M20/M25/M40 family metallo-hydrolase n=1 Tax=Neorhizobium galegae TaxID=399 RepID=UPI0006229D40|nr:M20/M25/M40 family metallo-hydrolase [Neorhizobium galegae]CDZ25433.1 Peptidase M20 [Neorhizobium galegae bv. officinalis]KAA9387691.1 M20/M25/M40 family metallo-hydrolase [Neorhizobium galegae]KAB1110370.1 M20/M25/M40 family metallo-hydrolase [Neorhizobium galegae]MCM2499041.1 M20/M25/M40 family metallo-hydrolase [Neorhizobium galegae]MCQ1772851.1 M20/M25/M40 family metallo-hydrolase [Neorhizobium galegae]